MIPGTSDGGMVTVRKPRASGDDPVTGMVSVWTAA